MPGIVGLITKLPREQAERELLRMLRTMLHESFYTHGTWVDESLGVYVGWVARQGSFADGMPLKNERGDLVLLFAGEEYPDPASVQQLGERGHEFEQDGAEYLVHVAEDDLKFPAGLNGRFHGLLADLKSGTARLFNDRYGMGRLYYHEGKEAFYFAAEAKAILAVRPELRRLDPRGLGEFITCGCVLENRSLFEGIAVLPPASEWTFRHSALEKQGHYFSPREWEEQEPLEPEAYYRELRDVFARNLPRYFNGRERIAMSLTGGLDTRMILAWHRPAPGALPCYTFGGPFRDSQDVIVARKVARECNQTHEAIRIGDEFLSRFQHYAARSVYLTDGTVSVAYSPDLYLNEQARDIASVRMTGNYGSEVLRGVRAFKPREMAGDPLWPELRSSIHTARETYAGLIRERPLTFAVFRQAPWHHYGLQFLEQTQLSLRSAYLDNDFVQTVFRAPQSASASEPVSHRLIGEGNPRLQRIPTDRGSSIGLNGLSTGPRRWLQEFTFKAEYAYDYGMPQWLARIDDKLRPLHPDTLFLGRHKFAHFRLWYRDHLADCIRELLLDSDTLSRPYFNGSTVETIVAGHLKGGHNYTAELHKVLTLELIHRLFLD